MIRKATPLFAAVLLACHAFGAASAQDTTPPDKLTTIEDRFDLALTGVGEYNTTVRGPVLPPAAFDAGQTITEYGSNTLGALATLRYIARPYFGLEFNVGYARYTENVTVNPLQIQSRASEYTFGYVVTPSRQLLGLQPWASAGAGSIAFKPTTHGGEGAPEQARMAYYYALGLQKDFSNGHFGLRAGFRELFFKDPDFEENYLTILKTGSTYEPMAGFYLRY